MTAILESMIRYHERQVVLWTVLVIVCAVLIAAIIVYLILTRKK